MSILGDAYDAQIKGFEGYAPRAKWDYKQSSVGWGTRASAPNEVIDRAEAQRRYDAEIGKAHGLVRSFAPNLDPGTTAALTSLTFNAGGDWMRSGLGQAVKAGDLDKARASFLQYVNAGGQPLDGLRKRRAAEVGWFGGAGPSGAQQASSQPMMQQSTGQPPMAQQEKPSLLQDILARTQNPMFQQGLGLLLASAQGKDMNAGMNAGTERAQSMHKVMMQNMALQQQEKQRAAMQQLMSDPAKMQGVPPAIVEMARVTGDPSPVLSYMNKTYKDPLTTRHQELQNQTLERNLQRPADDGSKLMEVNGQVVRIPRQGDASVVYGQDAAAQAQQQVAARRAQLVAAGMDPESGPAKVYMASGKMPREDQAPLSAVDKKAIMESEEMALSASDSIRALEEALRIGTETKDAKGNVVQPNMNSGFAATTRAAIADKLPDLLVPDIISSKEGAKNTLDFDNLVMGQALSSMKMIFGGNPTEGEREVLKELQASAGKSPAVRKSILERGVALARRRQQLYTDRANELRGQTYYKPAGQKPAATGANGAAAAPVDAPQGTGGALPRVRSIDEARRLPKGARFLDPQGIERVVP